MLGTNVEFFMSSYANAVQTLPGELQTHITAYLQSDLQHQHLLSLCKRYVNELGRSGDANEHKRLLRQLVISLLAIQDICDRRITSLDEMDCLVERHMQKLIAARANLTMEPTQSCASGTENTVESELEADACADSESRNGTTQSVRCRDTTQDEVNLKKSAYDDSEIESRSGTPLSVKRKVRLPLRNATQLNRSVGSRRVLGRWDSGTSRRRAGTSTLTGSKKTAIQALRQRFINDQRTRDRTAEERRHKVGANYSRYSTGPHTQKSNESLEKQSLPPPTQQQREHQRIKNQRVLSRAIHTSKNRTAHLYDSTRRRCTNTTKENKNRPTYLNSNRRLNTKLNRSSASRLSSRVEWSNPDQYYFNNTGNEPSARSASHVSTEDEKEETNPNSLMSPHHSSRSMDLSGWSKENGDEINGSEELEDSDYVDDDDDPTEGASLSMREIKSYCGKDPKSRLSSPPATTTGGAPSLSSRSPRINATRRRVSRLRKITDSESGYHRTSSERASQASPNSSMDISSVQPRGNPSMVYSLNSPMSKRREKAVYGTASRHHRSESKQTGRSALDEAVKHIDDAPQKSRLLGSSTEQSSDGSVSPDERLYCLCRKVSFGDMIACDNKLCQVEWFHFACVDIRVQPKGKWYCPFCRGDSSKVKRADL